ncbi:UNVERIFIED_CONTAM: hypothetical protein ABIC26_000769 [Paenibacillus sp. PvR008]
MNCKKILKVVNFLDKNSNWSLKLWNFYVKGGYDLKHTPTILAEFEEYLKQNNMTLAQFAEYSGVHQRTLSNWITQHRPVSVQ